MKTSKLTPDNKRTLLKNRDKDKLAYNCSNFSVEPSDISYHRQIQRGKEILHNKLYK